MSGHRKWSASGASRWLQCPASVQYYVPGDDGKSSAYAMEGTLAHSLATEALLNGGLVSPSYEGVTPEMVHHVQGFVDWVRDAMNDEAVFANLVQAWYERYYESSISKEFGGTADVTILADDLLWIVDLKYGAGVSVDVHENAQLMCYLLCAAEAFPQATKFRMTIYQPRTAGPPADTVDVTADELAEFKARVIDAMHRDEFKAGDHCRWCPGKAECEHLYQLTVDAAQVEFDDTPSDADKVARLLGIAKAVRAILDCAEQRARDLLKAGTPVDGYKLVESIGNRSWSMDETDIVKRLSGRRVSRKLLFNKSLKSPPQLEKDVPIEKFSDLVVRPVRGLSVVPSTDKRPPVTFSNPEEDFK